MGRGDRRIDRDFVRHSLGWYVSSIRPPFKRNGDIDYDKVREMVDFYIAGGSRTMLLTAGDSHYFTLSDEDISTITRVIVEHTAGRAMVVAADRHYNTGQALAFADYCRELGVDILMLMAPDWANSTTPQSLTQHYAAVSERIPVMLVTNHLKPRGDAFALATIEATLKQAPNVVAIKDDMLGVFGRKMVAMVRGRWATFAGGQKQNHLDMYPYGVDGYLATFITFKPETTHRYWDAIQRGDVKAAADVIHRYDWPFFQLIASFSGGFDAALHGVFEIFGRCERWRRGPYHSLTDEEMEKLRDGLAKIGIAP